MQYNYKSVVSIGIALFVSFTPNAFGLDVNIEAETPFVETVHEGEIVRIQRIQNQNNVLTGGFSKTSRKCPPFCIQPMHVAPGVNTIGELELLQFVKNQLNNGTGVLVDARTPSWHQKGTIPGSINIPFTTFDDDQDDLVKSVALGKLGVKKHARPSFVKKLWNSVLKLTGMQKSAKWDFTDAKDVLLWCNGMWCGQSPRAIKGLIRMGYPPEKLHYYRGGMQSWQLLGLTVVVPKQ
ncbi:MAG: rhodanese-like domain-containing protein [Gammaproteobacteria bacterium]|nr:rhodanese-like domain-containing protein [Gammaproteobacteria bacterium]MDH5801139.1 rhodanese-like domain-containing protein [Gammaproteobacteria bacterium]